MPDQDAKSVRKPVTWGAILIGEVLWCLLAGYNAGMLSLQRSVLLLAAVGFGTVLGVFSAFLFTSSGKEEEATFGKIRDWMLAGITGAGAAEVMEGGGSIKRLLLVFAPGNQSGDFALVLSTFVLGFGAGFFFMFFQRELNLNVLLAKARALTASAEGAMNASIVVHELLNKLPVNLLTSVNDVSDSGLSAAEREQLRTLLYSPDVSKFLDLTEERSSSGGSLDWDTIYKAALIHYYKTYFEPADGRKAQVQKSETWIQRALLLQPYHGQMSIAYSDLKAMQKDFDSAARIIRALIMGGDPPATALQLLGYYLLECDNDRESIHYSQMYMELYPDDSITIFNLAYSYGRMFCRTPDKHELRSHCLKLLSKGLSLDPPHATRIRDEWIPEGFQCFREDREFNDLLAKALARADTSESSAEEKNEPVTAPRTEGAN